MKFELVRGKRIGKVLFIVEGERTEPDLIYRVFSKILGFQMNRLYRDGTYRVFHRTNDPDSLVTVINTEESNIRFIDKNNDYLNHTIDLLQGQYDLDIPNTAIYYLFDRDPKSNTDKAFLESVLDNLISARDETPDWGQPGLLLLSYPCIESFVGMNLLTGSLGYCWKNPEKPIYESHELKTALNGDGLIPNKINAQTLLHCTGELFHSLAHMDVDTQADAFLSSLNQFGDNNRKVYDWQEGQYAARQQYGLLSLLTVALLDLGLIRICDANPFL